MVADISFQNGKAEAAFAMTPAWWDGNGRYVLQWYPNSEEMIKAAHLDWKVEKRKMKCAVSGKIIPGFYHTVRTDTEETLGCGMTDDYEVVQNQDGFDFLDSLVQDGIMKYESAGALQGGKQIWTLGRMPSIDEIAEGDSQCRYVLWFNGHAGNRGLYAIPTNVRVVCANTARAAIAGHRGIKHTSNYGERLEEARQIILASDAKFTELADKARFMAQKNWSKEDALQYINTLIPEPKGDAGKRSHSIRERKIEAIRDGLRHESNRLPSILGTYWQLYNAVSFAVDHGGLIGFRGNGRQRFENKMLSVMNGPGADLKDAAFDLAYEMAMAA